MKKKIVLVFIMIFSLFGVMLAGMLTAAKYNDNIALLCGENDLNSCNTVQNSDYSYILNVETDDGSRVQVPLSLAGMVFYIGLFFTSLFAFTKYKKNKSLGKIKYVLFGIGIIGVLFSAVYTWIQAYKIEAFCTYCLISAFDSLIIFILVSYIAFFKK